MTLRVTAGSEGEATFAIPRAGRALTRGLRKAPLFIWMVVLPGVLLAVYFLLLASPIYISRAQFIVRAPSQIQPTGFNAVLQGVGLAPAATDSFVVHDYVMSRDAIDSLAKQHHLREALGRGGLDFLANFPRPFETPTFEHLAEAYPRFVSVDYNTSTGISTLEVRAFRPQDAQEMASALLDGGETLVNHLNDRADQDAVTETQRQIAEAEADLGLAEGRLTSFRNRERLIDPNRSSLVNLDLMGKLQADIATLEAERAGIASVAPQSPQLAGLDSRIKAYQRQAQDEQAKMAGENDSLAPMIGEYETLSLERDFADKKLASAATAAEEARLEARRKRLYLERIASPNLPDSASEPHRLQSLATALATLLLIYGSVALVLAGLREHQHGE